MSSDIATDTARGPAHAARAHGSPDRREDSGAGDSAPATRASLRRDVSPPTRGDAVRDGVLATLGVVGLLTVVWLLAAWAFSLSIIVFVTGSMGPSLPTGAAAIVQPVPAERLQPGDIVTVTKPSSGNPVTHRIVAIDAVPTNPAARALTLKGDANSIVDSASYVVTEAKRVVVGAPLAGWIVIGARTPAVMLTLSLLLAAVIAWGLWPRRRRSLARSSRSVT